MTIFIIYIILLLIMKEIMGKDKKKYCICASLGLFFISACRAETVGVDMDNYISTYLSLKYIPYEKILFGFEKDQIFYCFSKLIADISNSNTYIYLSIIAAIFALSTGYFIYKNSANPSISFFLLLPLEIFYFSMTGLRQAVAISFIFIGYSELFKGKFIKFIGIVLLASLFHRSALVCLLILVPYILAKEKRIRLYKILIVVAIGLLARNQIINFGMKVFGTEGYEINAGGGMTTLIMYSFIFILVIFLDYGELSIRNNPKSYYVEIYCLLFTVITQSYVPYLTEFFRIRIYFLLPTVVLLPYVMENLKLKTSRNVLKVGLCSAFFLMFIFFTGKSSGIYPYSFFGG